MTDDSLIFLKSLVVQQADARLFENLNFDWRRGQHWAVIGESGKELTAFLETLRGNTILSSGIIQRPFSKDYFLKKSSKGKVHSYRDLIAYVSQKYELKNRSNLQNFYFQQRFNSSESEQTLTVREYLNQAVSESAGKWTVKKSSEILNLGQLMDQSLLKLSNGETRRLILALGLMKQPLIYLMDQPMTGLDTQTRAEFGKILKSIIQDGVHVLITCSPDEIPEGITHIAKLDSVGISQSWTYEDFPHNQYPISDLDWNWKLLEKLLPKKSPSNETLVQLEEVTIRYGQKLILDKLSWKIRSGERWLVKGPNGAGKSTLLSLLIGENPQAYSQNIYLFGRKRGSGESIWDVKKPTGFVAPELSRYFPPNQTCRKVILSGFFDTIGLFKKTTFDQESKAEDWLILFDLKSVEHVPIARLSLAQQRWTLLARAMIKEPRLLILDEASQGLDDSQRALFKTTIEKICELTLISLIYISHYTQDVPLSISQTLDLGQDQ